ncbi:hypothetical protein GCM10023350_10650 [Nocardioides endophyticus]|uniref:DUF4397 domain-containing protein n=2 Tax=Nocardioides endophyticus TaxID=1353775 RepID=A0ABP8YIA7_9ACTN
MIPIVVMAAAAVSTTSAAAPAAHAPASPGQLFVVQAVPGATYAVSVDGEEQTDKADVGAVLGPIELDAGDHTVRFEPGSGEPMSANVRIRAGGSVDLVLHLPADPGGDPVADVYRVSAKPAAPDTARVLVAHTATVPPADVRVDGQVVFEDIANGEFATADVPAGQHSAEVVPAGTSDDPILGPLDVDLPAGTVTMVYAVGTPTDGSMNVISHQESIGTTNAAPLREIGTGSAGLVRTRQVTIYGR